MAMKPTWPGGNWQDSPTVKNQYRFLVHQLSLLLSSAKCTVCPSSKPDNFAATAKATRQCQKGNDRSMQYKKAKTNNCHIIVRKKERAVSCKQS
jgi:hypothetical protein